MQSILSVTLPFFALVAGGFVAGRRGVISTEGVRGLNAFVFYFAVPALLFRAMALRDFSEILQGRFLGGYLLGGLVVFAATALLGRLIFRQPLGVLGLMGQAATVGNVGFLGLPLIVALMGTDATVPVALALLIDLVVMIPISITLLEMDRADGHRAARDIAAAVLLNPFVLSMLAGIAWAALGVGLPKPIAAFTGLLANAAGPAALFALGATLAGRPWSEGVALPGLLGAIKLMVHPLAVAAGLALVGFDDPVWRTAAILTAAMPVAGNVFVIAQQFEVFVARASTAILLSTAAGVVTVSALIWLFGL